MKMMMEEEQEQTTEPTQNPKPPAVCEECKSNPSKYKCPATQVASCDPVALLVSKLINNALDVMARDTKPSSFLNLNSTIIFLLSDYNLLEEVKSVADSAQRAQVKLCGYHFFKPPFHLQSLKNAAGYRRTKLLFLPNGMSKRERNKSRYNQRKIVISWTWTIEWRFHSTDVV